MLYLVACKTDHVCFEIYLLPEQVSQFVVAHAREQSNHEERVMVWIAYREKSDQLNTAVNANFLFLVALESLVDGRSDESLRLQSTVEEETTEASVPPRPYPVRVTLVQLIAVADYICFCDVFGMRLARNWDNSSTITV